MEYELVHEIKNHCPNNQMRDIFIDEVETRDPESYVRSVLHGTILELRREAIAGGEIIHAECDGIVHVFTFTAL